MVLSAAVNVAHPLENAAHIDFQVDGQIEDLPKLDVTGHKVRADGAHLSAAGEFDLNPQTHSATNGSAEVSVELSNPLVQIEGASARVNGTLGAHLKIRDFQLHQAHKAPSFKGTLEAFMQEERRRALELNFRVHKSGRLSVSPLHNTVSHLIDLPFGMGYPEPTDSKPAVPGALGRVTKAEFARQMETLTKSRVTDNNRVELLVDGVRSLPKRLQLIKEAKDSICLQTLVFQDDACGMQMAQALADAAKRGVKVRLIVDGQGAADNLKNIIAENKAYKVMIDAGVDLRIHNEAVLCGLKDIVDVLVDNRLTHYSREELLGGNISTLGALICEFVIKLQNGQLELPEEQRRKFVRGINKGLGRPLDDVVDAEHVVLPTDKNGVVQLGGFIDRAQKVIQQIYSWHEKHFIVDGKIGIWGGMNIAGQYLGDFYINEDGKLAPAWRDTDLLLEGPAVDDGVAAFAKNWHHLTGEKIRIERQNVEQRLPGTDVKVQIIQHSPSISGDNHITDFLIANLNRMQPGESAYFENAYFCVSTTLSPLYTAMINAARRGVQIVVLTNSEVSTDLPAINNAAFHTYRDLMKAGVRIFERKDDRTIHSKIAVIGKDVSIVGSANLDNRSARVNSEVIAVVYDENFANVQRDVILEDLSTQIAHEITREDLAAISPIKSARFAAMSLIRDLC
jgi:phosphatidylserine/phosphatidylglycerophosphate/cardiolipin synthase-like enzyme